MEDWVSYDEDERSMEARYRNAICCSAGVTARKGFTISAGVGPS